MACLAVTPVADMQETLRITEIFYSLQGETRTAGLPTVFVRLTGCPLRCQYCDTAYAFSGGEIMALDAIIEQVAGVYPKIMKDGAMDAGVWSCGMVAGLIRDVPSCKELIDRIMAEADSIIHQRLAGFAAR